ncbi:hypothetical protein CIB48_g11334 [Xylaria polymorpha]|nr:hypothetical protein CIB48_g11334 [Xylaria polymorpha]
MWLQPKRPINITIPSVRAIGTHTTSGIEPQCNRDVVCIPTPSGQFRALCRYLLILTTENHCAFVAIATAMPMFGFPYREPHPGFWGEKTVTLNFCEEDYVMSYYCAEFCNTVTNILFLWLGARGIRGCFKHGHPPIFLVAFIGYIIVGCGSTLFHATLKYPMQLVDELAMIYTTCFMAHATFAYARSSHFSFALGIGLIGLASFITARYYQTKDPQFHAYALLTATVVFSNMWIMERVLRPALKAREDKRAPSSPRAECPSVYLRNVDHGCNCIVWRIWIHRCLDGDEDKFRLYWPSVFHLPEVRSVEDLPSVREDKKRHGPKRETMSISNEALQKLLREVETQAIASQQQIALTRTQQAAKQREMRMAQLTRTELSSLPAETNVYEGVGKMFVSLPVTDMRGKLETQIKQLEGDVETLGKRLHYLEVSQKNSKDQIDRMLRGGVGAS